MSQQDSASPAPAPAPAQASAEPASPQPTSQNGGALARFRKRLSSSFIGVRNKSHETPSSAAASAREGGAGGGGGNGDGHETTAVPAPAVPEKDASVPKRKPSTRKGPTTSSKEGKAPPALPSTAEEATAFLTQAHMPDYTPAARSLGDPKSSLLGLYPPIEPYASGTLVVEGGLHSIYWELSGKKGGKPVVFLHGGPGGGTSADDRRWFDPAVYQVLVFDQRGAGRSTPSASLEKNDTWSLVQDIEQLRVQVAGAPDKWHVFGGSWGSTLALSYAQTHPERVSALILRGIFTLRKSELRFFYQDGASHIFPELFARYRDFIPAEERDDLIGAYHARLTGADEGVRLEAAKRWAQWEDSTCRFYVPVETLSKGDADKRYLEFARIENHFFHHAGFFPSDGHLLSAPQLAKIAHIPTTIVQGRYDVVCPATSAWDLHTGLLAASAAAGTTPRHKFVMVPDAGHSAKEAGVRDALRRACDAYREV